MVTTSENNFIKTLSLIIALIITFIFLTILPYSLQDIYGTWGKTKGIITNNPVCTIMADSYLFNCSPIIVKFKVDDDNNIYEKEYEHGIITKNKYKHNDEINIWYEKKSNPIKSYIINQMPTFSGKISILVILIFLILSWSWVLYN